MFDCKLHNCLCSNNFYLKFVHGLDIITMNECLVVKNLLMNVTKINEHSNVTIFACSCPNTYICMYIIKLLIIAYHTQSLC